MPDATADNIADNPALRCAAAGQPAGCESHRRDELDANGSELHRYFSVARGALITVRSNGVTLCRQVDDEWKMLSRKKGDVPLAQWVVNKQAALSGLVRWQLDFDACEHGQSVRARPSTCTKPRPR